MPRRINVVFQRPPNRARPSVAYGAQGFRYFLDRVTRYGLEFFQLYYGVYKAKVVSNEDPDNEGQPDPYARLTVYVPSVGDGESVRRVAWPMSPIGGPSYGFKSLPSVDDNVYVMFEGGRLDAPLWIGGWWARGDMPDDLQDTDSHGWFTPGGHQILLDDISGSEVIRIKHSDGETRVELDQSGNVFVVNKANSKVNIGDGAENANEPAALGESLKGLLEEILDAINAMTVPTPAGPSGTPTNAVQFSAIKARLTTMLSQTVNLK